MRLRFILLFVFTLAFAGSTCIDRDSGQPLEREPGSVIIGVTGIYGPRAGTWPENVKADVRAMKPGIGYLSIDNMRWPHKRGMTPEEMWRGDYSDFAARLEMLQEELGIERIHFKCRFNAQKDEFRGLSYDGYMNHHARARV
jgi:hypothetical protein